MSRWRAIARRRCVFGLRLRLDSSLSLTSVFRLPRLTARPTRLLSEPRRLSVVSRSSRANPPSLTYETMASRVLPRSVSPPPTLPTRLRKPPPFSRHTPTPLVPFLPVHTLPPLLARLLQSSLPNLVSTPNLRPRQRRSLLGRLEGRCLLPSFPRSSESNSSGKGCRGRGFLEEQQSTGRPRRPDSRLKERRLSRPLPRLPRIPLPYDRPPPLSPPRPPPLFNPLSSDPPASSAPTGFVPSPPPTPTLRRRPRSPPLDLDPELP